MRAIRSTLWLRKTSMSVQMANETTLCAEESWVVRTRNHGSSGWYGSAFSKFPAQLSSCVSSGFIDFHSKFGNFTPLLSILRQVFRAIRVNTERFYGDLQCVFEVLSLSALGVLALRQFAVEQFFFGRRWSFMQTWPAKWSSDCIKMA